ncbi:hypothetical protein ACIRL2_25795 [Embleya sp. NPDC127516]|uniref:hypothetical protein n=1 Tax=Embleya sp. NPDC127516 TaxID=3363990 RepID=UPI0038064E35
MLRRRWPWRGGRQGEADSSSPGDRPLVALVSLGTRPSFPSDRIRMWLVEYVRLLGLRCDDVTIDAGAMPRAGESAAWAEQLAPRLDGADVVLLLRPQGPPEAWKVTDEMVKLACDAVRTRWAAKPFGEVVYTHRRLKVLDVPGPHDAWFRFRDRGSPWYPQDVVAAVGLRLRTLLERA